MTREQQVVVEPSRDAELRALVRARHHPDDSLVYADWLEEQGDLARAAFLRKQHALRALPIAHRKLIERGRELFELGAKLPRDWIAEVTELALAGTAWEGKDSDGALVLRFLPSGFVNYTQPSGTFENGRWEQVGITVAMETNAHYADYFGVIIGDTIRGDAHNIVDFKWRWKVKRTRDSAIERVPDDTNRTIHDEHRRAAPKAAKPARPAKPAKPARPAKPAKPSTRTSQAKRAPTTTRLARRTRLARKTSISRKRRP